MTLDEVALTLEWARREGWNPGLDDAEVFHTTDPGGFWLGRVDDEPVSSISVVRYGESYAFLGLYIVAPEQRGHGHGWELWQHALASIPAHVTVGLDGVPAQQDAYRRSGFVLAHRNARWGGRVDTLPPPPPQVRDLGPQDLAASAAYDLGVFLAPRAHFLEAWLTGAASRRAVGYVEDGSLAGYGCLRRCHEGWKIGPLFADRPEVAEALTHALVGPVAPGPVFLDVPEPHGAAVALATSLGLTPAFETARMYRGTAPHVPLDRIYGITTLELG